VRAEAIGELADALDRLVASLADDVCCAELSRQCNPVWMMAKEDDPLGAEASGGDHAAQADSAVADDGHGLDGTYRGAERRMVACRHHVREREQRWHQRVVFVDRQDDECPVCLGDPYRLALPTVHSVPAIASSEET
jgi:hypothetical protein